MQKKEYTGTWIPKHIIEDTQLSITEKWLYAEIASFDMCFMSNELLGERLGVSKETISRHIGKLKNKGYIIDYGTDGRNRKLKAKLDLPSQIDDSQIDYNPSQIDEAGSSNCSGLPSQNDDIKNKERTKKEQQKTILEIFTFWNDFRIKQGESMEFKLIQHKTLTADMHKQIEKRLAEHDVTEIKTAIKNYAEILESPATFWEHRWTLTEFFSRKNGMPVFLHKSKDKDYVKKNLNTPQNVIQNEDMSKYQVVKNNAKYVG